MCNHMKVPHNVTCNDCGIIIKWGQCRCGTRGSHGPVRGCPGC
jgi:hypothetical protein